MDMGVDNLGEFFGWVKPNWDEYFIGQTFHVAIRSIDPATKHGCIVTDLDHRPLTFYGEVNSHCIDENSKKIMEIMLKDRDLKVLAFNGDVKKTLGMTLDYYLIKVLGKEIGEGK